MRHALQVAVCLAASLPLSAQTKLASGAPSHASAIVATDLAPRPSRYLYVWSSTMDTTKAAARPYDFLAVVDLQPDDSTVDSR